MVLKNNLLNNMAVCPSSFRAAGVKLTPVASDKATPLFGEWVEMSGIHNTQDPWKKVSERKGYTTALFLSPSFC